MTSMNFYRMSGDICHLMSLLIVLIKLFVSRTAQGLSVKTHELFLLVFVMRYLDLFTNFISVYNSVMKLIYIITTARIVYTMHYQEPQKSTYDRLYDTFPHWKYALIPASILELFTCFEFDMECLWTFSIYLEVLAMVPQLVLLQQLGECDNVTGLYIFFMFLYRGLYVLNWIHRANTEPYYIHNEMVFSCGVVQTMIYVVFFGCIFRSNASLRHKKDDSQLVAQNSDQLNEPLLAHETESMIGLSELHHVLPPHAKDENDANIENVPVDKKEDLLVV